MMTLFVLPYFTLGPWPKEPLFSIGSFHAQIPAFGLLVAMGVVLAVMMGTRKAKQLGLPRHEFQNMAFFLLIIGWLAAHIFEVVFYHPDFILKQPMILLDITNGFSSYGGLIGGIAAFFIWTRGPYRKDRILWAEAAAWSLPFAWFFGRIGCSVVHDHPGSPAPDWWPLAIDFSDPYRPWLNGPRHDLGFYEAIWWFVILIVMLMLNRKPRRPGFYLWLLPILYAPVRFGLDFLRVSDAAGGDTRYLGLTPAQYLSIVLAGVAIYFVIRYRYYRTSTTL
ncbi:MAG: prolipoprotein diacylglyceryl transferase [Deltaproteobacteria bacterium]|nr:prolipoprotein diacylglyceryl transferase [Deltaproteobacteria bacterium]